MNTIDTTPQKRGLIPLPSYPDAGGCASTDDTPQSPPGLNQSFVTGSVSTPTGPLPKVSSRLTWQDRWGTIKARWGVGRMEYSIDPGLYALGNPDRESPVLVTANYKMSFDELRGSLPERNLWILVLDTEGINVWCAAGKGTFGTEELVRMIAASGLGEIVNHRSLILPQLGAPGVAAHTVKKLSCFRVHYGPIKAADLPAYLDAGGKVSGEMRLKSFTIRERAVLIPVELVEALKPALIITIPLVLLHGVGVGGLWTKALWDGMFAVLAFWSAVIGGAVIHPLLLPYLPGRAFSTKGLTLGAAVAAILLFLHGGDLSLWADRLGALAWLLIIPAVTAYLAMNFTGCSTYTSPSGVNKEMRWALPLEMALGLAGLIVLVASRLIA